MPELHRTPAAPSQLDLSVRQSLRRKFGLSRSKPARGWSARGWPPRGWERVVAHRQRLSLGLTAIATCVLLAGTWSVLDRQGMSAVTMTAYLAIYGAMNFFLMNSFWKTVLGIIYVLRGEDRNPWHPVHWARDPLPGTRVAILFPVFHEDVARVAAGMAATWESIERTAPGLAGRFDLFLISDSRLPEYAIAEEAAVYALRARLPGARVYYRRRTRNANAKLGNIEDFCRRWGGDYKYMLVMDADSVMDGEAVVSLLRMMEGNDRIGILQTNPKPVLRETLFGRMQQFSGRLYGSVFSYSLMVMYMGDASYIGHNAMVRVKPFMEHCFLPQLPGRKPWGGKPLSHDIVESAMMARAGYEVWFLPEIAGSFEEVPANILAFLVRERRWMQGNLQHLRFLFLPGLRSIHRETFLNGSLGYVAAPLWAMFLVLSTFWMVDFLGNGLAALGELSTLRLPMAYLMVSGLIFLFLPRIIALAIHLERKVARGFGGKAKLTASVVLESAFSLVFSPIIMLSVTRFLWLWVKRRGIVWGTQQRGDETLPWRDCLAHFTWISLIGLAALAALALGVSSIPQNLALIMETMSDGWARGDYLLYAFSPVLFAFIASVWIVRVTSKRFPAIERMRLFSIPEEADPPEVLERLRHWLAELQRAVPDPADREATIAFATADPRFIVQHQAQTRARGAVAERMLDKLQRGEALQDEELMLALNERRCFEQLQAR